MKNIRFHLDQLLQDGYFYNREWVRRGRRCDDICMEFEHFLTKKKKYLWIRKRLRERKIFFDRKRSKWAIVYSSDKPPRAKGFRASRKGETPYLQGLLKKRGIDAVSDCWQEIRKEAFSYGELSCQCCCSLYREVEDSYSTPHLRCRCQVGEFVYEDELAESNGNCEFKYLYIAKVETSLIAMEETLSIRQFINYIRTICPEFYIMRTAAPLEEIKLPDGAIIKMNVEGK